MCTVFHPFTIAVVLSCFNNVLSSTPITYECFEDVCNLDPLTPEYCWDARQICRKCSDIKDSCREPEMPANCTDFCIDHELFKVKAKPCSSVDVPSVANGIANITKDQSVPLVQGSEVEYICREGYRLTGRTSVCGVYGQWSSPPICQAIVCDLPKVNGMSFSPSASHYDVGSLVHIECLGSRKGTGTLTCTPNGTWDQELPRCEDPIVCDLPKVNGMSFSPSASHYDVGSLVHIECLGSREGTGTLTCTPNGTWDQELPRCEDPIVCDLPKVNGMSFSPSASHYDVGSLVHIECLGSREGTGTLTCTPNGTWDQELPRCEDLCPPWQLAATVTFGITTMILMVIVVVLICCYKDKRFHRKKSYDIEERSDGDSEISEETSLVEQQHSATEKIVKEQMPTDEKGVSEPEHTPSVESHTQSGSGPKVEESRKCGSKVPPRSIAPKPEEQTEGAFGGSDDNTPRLPLLQAGGLPTEVCRRELDSSCNYSNTGKLPHNTQSTSTLPLDSLLGSDTGTGPRSTTETTEGTGPRSTTETTEGTGPRSTTETTEGTDPRSTTETTEGTEEDTRADPSPCPRSAAVVLKTGKNGKNNGLIGNNINIDTYVHIQQFGRDGQPNDREADTVTAVPVEDNLDDKNLPFPVQEGRQKRRTVVVEPANHDEMEVKL